MDGLGIIILIGLLLLLHMSIVFPHPLKRAAPEFRRPDTLAEA